MNYDLEEVKKDVVEWVINFCEVPNPAFNGFAPCPYAKKARKDGDFEVRLGTDPYLDLLEVANNGPLKVSVLAIIYDPKEWPHEQFSAILNAANLQHLLKNDIIALEDHPDDAEIVNGVCLNQGKYAMALIQNLSDLNTKAAIVAKKGFYDSWPEEYLTMLFKHRQDPRK